MTKTVMMSTRRLEVVGVGSPALGPGASVIHVALGRPSRAPGEGAGGRGDSEPPAERDGHAVRLAIEDERRGGHGVGQQPDPRARVTGETTGRVEVDRTVPLENSGVAPATEKRESGDRDDDGGLHGGGRLRAVVRRCVAERVRRGRGGGLGSDDQIGEHVGAKLRERALFVGRRAEMASGTIELSHHAARARRGEQSGDRCHSLEFGGHPDARSEAARRCRRSRDSACTLSRIARAATANFAGTRRTARSVTAASKARQTAFAVAGHRCRRRPARRGSRWRPRPLDRAVRRVSVRVDRVVGIRVLRPDRVRSLLVRVRVLDPSLRWERHVVGGERIG